MLAVGDARFQEKCYDHIATLQRKGVTIIMVSHDLSAVERFSDRAALMERGRMVLIGKPQEVVTRHIERLAETSPEIRRALEDGIEELIATSPEAKERFDEALKVNPDFLRMQAEKQAQGQDDATPEPPAG